MKKEERSRPLHGGVSTKQNGPSPGGKNMAAGLAARKEPLLSIFGSDGRDDNGRNTLIARRRKIKATSFLN